MFLPPIGLTRHALDGAIEQTIQGILTAADPMQALIDAMQFTGGKPDYMYGGDGPADFVEIGGSGFDLVETGTVDQGQTSAVLGPGNFSVFNAFSDGMRNSTDAALQPGSGSFAALWVGNITTTSGNHVFGDTDGTLGWRILTGGASQHRFYLQSVSGLNTVTIPGTVPLNVGEVALAIKDATLLDAHLHTSLGTATNAAVYNESVDNPTQQFAVGDTGTGNSADFEFGLAAFWKGAVAESLTQTHRNNLATWLGF